MPGIWHYQRERALRVWRMKRPFVEHDAAIRHQVADSSDDAVGMSAYLVDYFWQAQRHYLHRHATLAYYPGWPSIYGATNDAVEGVTRLMPLWAAYASSPLAEGGRGAAMWSALRTTLVHGTDPAHPGYWGDIDDRSTLICEAADVALAVWLGRDHLWPALGEDERRRVLSWLRQAVGKRTADNNWHLFVVLVDAVLTQLDPAHRYASADRLDRIRGFRVSDGCFTDGPGGAVDFYNAWGFHHALFWLGEIDGSLLDHPLRQSLAEFCTWYQWLFTNEGLPLFGRSLCYRFATSAPLIACALRSPQVTTPGVSLAAYLSTWRFFVGKGGLAAGRPTQGVFADDVRWLDPYSGPASSFWGTRSTVAFYYAARTVDWKRTAVADLPAEHDAFEIDVPALPGTVRSLRPTREVAVSFRTGQASDSVAPPRARTMKDALRESIFAVASRPSNNLLRAGVQEFRSNLQVYVR